jgi:hypothetical protein
MRRSLLPFLVVLAACGGNSSQGVVPDAAPGSLDARGPDARVAADAAAPVPEDGGPQPIDARPAPDARAASDAPLADAPAAALPDGSVVGVPDGSVAGAPDGSVVGAPDAPVVDQPDAPVVMTPDAAPPRPDARVLDARPALDAPPDAMPVNLCGNGVVDLGEKCDVAIAPGDPGACPTSCDDSDLCTHDTLSGAGCQAQCVFTPLPPTDGDGICCPPSTIADDSDCGNQAFRLTALSLEDPHVYLMGLTSCNDLTAAVNTSIQNDLGSFQINPVLYFQPLNDKAGATTKTDFELAMCTNSSDCAHDPSKPDYSATATNQTSVCADLDLIDATHNTMYGAIDTPPAPCFTVSYGTVDLTIPTPLGDLALEFEDSTVGAEYDPAHDRLIHGLLVGFMTQTYADSQTYLGRKLSHYLAGGAGACPAFSDEDTNGGTAGWWFYLKFTAQSVPFSP